MKYILDASVSLRWVLPDTLSTKARQLRDEFQRDGHELFSPDIYIDEIASALTKAERQKVIPVGQAAPLYVKVMNTPPVLLSRLSLISRAIEISSQTKSSYYDCLYVALAERKGCELLTADARLLRNLQKRFPFMKALSSFP